MPMEDDQEDLEIEEAEDTDEEDVDLDTGHRRRGRLRPHSPGLLRLALRIVLRGLRVRGHPPVRRR